jgi:hypothetical protein
LGGERTFRYVLLSSGLDIVPRLPAWTSDSLCRLASGDGFAVRRLYTDEDEALFEAARPTILNGIEDVIARADLADRGIFLSLPHITATLAPGERILAPV